MFYILCTILNRFSKSFIFLSFLSINIFAMDNSRMSNSTTIVGEEPTLSLNDATNRIFHRELYGDQRPIFVTAQRPIFIMGKDGTQHNDFSHGNENAGFKERFINAMQGGVLDGVALGIGQVFALVIIKALVMTIEKGAPTLVNHGSTNKVVDPITEKNNEIDREATTLKIHSDMIEKYCAQSQIKDKETFDQCQKLKSQLREMLSIQATLLKNRIESSSRTKVNF